MGCPIINDIDVGLICSSIMLNILSSKAATASGPIAAITQSVTSALVKASSGVKPSGPGEANC